MTNRIEVEYAPAVPGLVFRRYRGPQDHPGMVDAINADYRAADIEMVHSVEALDTEYAELDNCDPERDIVVAEVDGRIIGYGRTTWRLEADGTTVHYNVGTVHTDFQGLGIGTALHRVVEERAVEIAVERGAKAAIDGWAWDSQKAKRRIYQKAGYDEVSFDALMIRPHMDDIPDLAVPDGLVVRAPTEEEMRTVWEADIEAFRDHWGFTEPVPEDFARFLKFEWRDPTLWRVAWDGDEVAGQVRSFIDVTENETFGRKRGWTEFISTRRPHRRKGLARALLAQSLTVLAERGMTEAALGVHIDNPNGAFALYESVGFRVVKTESSFRKVIKA